MDKAAPAFVGIDVSKHRLEIHLRPSGESFTIDHDDQNVARSRRGGHDLSREDYGSTRRVGRHPPVRYTGGSAQAAARGAPSICRSLAMKEVGRRAFGRLCAAGALGFGLGRAAARAAEVAHPPHGGSVPTERTQPASVGLRSNAAARQAIARLGMDPPRASRVLMLLSVAQHDAAHHVLAANKMKPGDEAGAGPCRSEMTIALAEAYRTVLRHVAPEEEPSTDIHPEASELHSLVAVRRSENIGRKAARRALKWRRGDEAALQRPATPPVGPTFWRSLQDQPPVRPWWGWARPVVLPGVKDFVAPPPPEVGTSAFSSALAEVREAAAGVDDAKLATIHFWADGKGTPTPPGHWNEILQGILEEGEAPPETRVLRLLSLLNIATMDAGIACWRTKFTYWTPRPRQIDYRIPAHLTEPNFPSYTSGHSAFSNAAAEVIGAVLPDHAGEVRRWAEEASLSRLHAGIHYRFDVEEGADQGRRVGRLVARLAGLDGPLLPYLG
jgi:hypothetical protein